MCRVSQSVRFLSRLDLIHVESSLRKYKSELNGHQHTNRKERGLAGHALGESAQSWFRPNFKIYLLLHISFMSHILPNLYDPENQVDRSNFKRSWLYFNLVFKEKPQQQRLSVRILFYSLRMLHGGLCHSPWRRQDDGTLASRSQAET